MYQFRTAPVGFICLLQCLYCLLLPADAQRNMPRRAPATPLVLQWEWSVPETQLVYLIASNSHNFAFYRRDPGELVGVDRITGATVWRLTLPECHAVAGDTCLYLQESDGSDELHCLDWNTGHELWHVTLPDQAHLLVLPQCPESVFYATVGTRHPERTASAGCLDGSTGNVKWQNTAERSYLGTARGFLYFVGSTYAPYGNALYRLSAETGHAMPGDRVPIPAVSGDAFDTYFTYLSRHSLYLFYTMIVNTGLECSSFVVADSRFNPLWSQYGVENGAYSGPVDLQVSDDMVVFGFKNFEGVMTSITARRLKTGRQVWSVRLPPTRLGETNHLVGIWHGVLLHEFGDRLLGRHLTDGKTF